MTTNRDPAAPREPSITVVHRLWTTFAAVWLLVLVITMGLLADASLTLGRYAATLIDLSVLAVLYLWLTLRIAPVGEEERVGTRQRVAAVAAMALLVAPLVYLVPSGGMWWHAMYAVVAAGLALRPIVAMTVIGTLVGAAMLAAWFVAGVVELRLLIQLAIGAAAMAVRLLAIVVQQLRAARVELARRAADEERLRIARDLHDLLGHSLSLIVLKSQLARRLADASPAATANELSEIERSARNALHQVRAAVSGYRQPTLQGELAAARELLVASGMRSVVEDAAGPLPVNAERLLAWAVREAVTNVIRHSRARECVIRTLRQGDCAVVSIVDDGLGVPDADFVAGSGLTGLAERAEALSARLTMGRGPAGGFTLALAVPITVSTNGDGE